MTQGMKKVLRFLLRWPGSNSRTVADGLFARSINGEWTASRLMTQLEKHGYLTGENRPTGKAIVEFGEFDPHINIRLDFVDADVDFHGCRYTHVDPQQDPQEVANQLVARTRKSPDHKGVTIKAVRLVRMQVGGPKNDEILQELQVVEPAKQAK